MATAGGQLSAAHGRKDGLSTLRPARRSKERRKTGLASSSSGAGLRRARRRDTTHRQGRTAGGEVVLQLSRAEEGRVKHSDVPQQPVHVRS